MAIAVETVREEISKQTAQLREISTFRTWASNVLFLTGLLGSIAALFAIIITLGNWGFEPSPGEISVYQWSSRIAAATWSTFILTYTWEYLHQSGNREWLKEINLEYHYTQCRLWLRRYERLCTLIDSGGIEGDEAIALRDAAEGHIQHHQAAIQTAWVEIEVEALGLPEHIVADPELLPDFDEMTLADFDERLQASEHPNSDQVMTKEQQPQTVEATA